MTKKPKIAALILDISSDVYEIKTSVILSRLLKTFATITISVDILLSEIFAFKQSNLC